MTELWVAIAVALDGAAALVGGLLPDRWLTRYRPAMLGFATGALVSAAAFDLVPEAYTLRGLTIVPWLIGSVLVLAVAVRLFAHRGRNVTPYALLGSDALHNFGDGMAIAASFLASTNLGVVTSLAVIVHEVPEELADYAVLRNAGMPRRRSLFLLTLVQFTAGLGAAATLLGASAGAREGIVIAIAAGTFFYIAIVELLPDVLRRDRAQSLTALAAGALVVAAVSH